MNLASINISAILPAVVLSVFGIAVMVAEPFVTDRKKSKLGWLAFSGTLAGMLALVPMADNSGPVDCRGDDPHLAGLSPP